MYCLVFFFFSSRRRHTRCSRDWSSDVCSSDLLNAKPREVFQNFGSEIVFLGREFVLEMRGHAGLADAAGIGARGMKKRAARAAGAIDDFFVQQNEVVGIVVILFADHVHKPGPAVPNTDNLIALAQSAERDATNRRVQTGHVAASGENANDAFLGADVSHEITDCPFLNSRREIIHSGAILAKSEAADSFLRTNECKKWFGDYSSIFVPRIARNLASHAGCAGHAGAVTRFPSAMASVIARLTYVPPACVTSGPTAG